MTFMLGGMYLHWQTTREIYPHSVYGANRYPVAWPDESRMEIELESMCWGDTRVEPQASCLSFCEETESYVSMCDMVIHALALDGTVDQSTGSDFLV